MKRILPLIMFLLVAAAPAVRGAKVTPGKKLAPTPGYDYALGRKVYLKACAKCHEKGISGAPKIGDRKAWSYRIPQGRQTLIRHVIDGFMCNRGVLPPRGGDRSLTDEEIAAATHYILDNSR